MNIIPKYWKIECTRHLTTLYQTKVSTKELSEKELIEFIRVLLAKYALSDNEILQQYTQRPFTPKQESIVVKRTQGGMNEPVNICFMATVADISVTASLTD